MKKLIPLLAFGLIVATGAPSTAHASTTKKGAKDTAFADTWAAASKTYAGKKVSTAVIEVGEIGTVADDAPCAVVPVTTGNTEGKPGGEILALMPTKDVAAFMAKAGSATKSKGGAFGGKVTYPAVSATYVLVEGEAVLVFGETPKLGGKKPSALLAAQHAASPAEKTAAPAAEEPAPEAKKPKKKSTR